jgi:hypothetical protein
MKGSILTNLIEIAFLALLVMVVLVLIAPKMFCWMWAERRKLKT